MERQRLYSRRRILSITSVGAALGVAGCSGGGGSGTTSEDESDSDGTEQTHTPSKSSGNATIAASNMVSGQTAAHSLTVPVQTSVEGQQLQTITIRYDEGVDLSNVEKGSVTVYVGEQLGSAQQVPVESVSVTDGGQSLELTLDGSATLGTNKQVVAEYEGVSMPERRGRYAVVITLNDTASETGILEVTGEAGVIASDFEKTVEGWRIKGDAQGSSTFPNHEQSGGNPGRCLSAVDDVQGGVWYWVAPRQFVGDKSAYRDGELRFDIYQNNRSSQFNAKDVILSGPSTELVYNFGDVSSHPQTDWTSYTVPLQATSSWTVGSLDGETATADQFETVMGDLQSLAIRGEYVSGSDTGYLDNPAIVPANKLDGEPEATIQTPEQS